MPPQVYMCRPLKIVMLFQGVNVLHPTLLEGLIPLVLLLQGQLRVDVGHLFLLLHNLLRLEEQGYLKTIWGAVETGQRTLVTVTSLYLLAFLQHFWGAVLS